MICTKEWVKDLLSKVLKKKLNNYSLEEQKVGTWIDGKPLYEKTFMFKGTYTGDQNFPIDIENVDTAFIKGGMITDTSCGVMQLNYAHPSESWQIGCFYNPVNKVIGFRPSTSYANQAITKVIVTIQYTKTTD